MQYTNAQKLAAVLNKWAAPLVQSLVENNISMVPFVANIERKMKGTGWVSPAWSVTKELSPLLSNVTSAVVEPILSRYISDIPDEAIPKVAHTMVDNAIRNGGDVQLMEGKICFSQADMLELKKYLNYNLPIGDCIGYEVKNNE